MAELLLRFPPTGTPAPAGEDAMEEYSFALEYHGPPIAYDLPRAVPIDIKDIPTASVVSTASLSDCQSLPVIQPLPSPPKDSILGPDPIASPTSVIAFDHAGRNSSSDVGSSNAPDRSCEFSGEIEFSNGDDPSCDLSGEIGSSRVLDSHESSPGIDCSSVVGGSSNGHDHSRGLSGAIGSSGVLDSLDERIGSSELSGKKIGSCGELGELLDDMESSGVLGRLLDCKESVDFSNEMNLPDWASTESVISSPFLSSEDSSRKLDDYCNDGPPNHGKRRSLVTFIDAHSSDKMETESYSAELGVSSTERREPDLKIKKGSCRRCLKGNRFTEKETCIVCRAKYCSSCVLRAMGSMPEGRKCVTCIGCPIDESRRPNLGKCSRMLKRLLSPLEIQLAMKAERSCEANQLQPEHIYVNGKQLCQEELVILHSCPNPPNKLKPGRYWYDRVSGFWGKEGDKPCEIISPNLNVGGDLQQDASNGNTKILMNGREITKVELRMLKWAGVQCAGNPHFWVHADGSYQEEGQKNMRGNIWAKASTKLYCSLLALPVPKSSIPSGEEVNNVVSRNVPDYLEQRILQKLLLVGCDGSGTSTLFKQAKFLYQDCPFSEEELENIKNMIQSSVYYYLGILLEGRERFEEECLAEIRNKNLVDQSVDSGHVDEGKTRTMYSISPKLKVFSDWLLKVMASGSLEAIFPAATREYAPLVEELWRDDAIRATYSRRNELQMLPSAASYFLERVVDISKMEYEPSTMDILYAEGITSSNGLAHMDFLFPQSAYDNAVDPVDQHDPMLRYELIRVHARSLGENCKWLEMFEDVRLVIFCVALSDYDQLCDDGTGIARNKMLVSRRFFESIVSHPTFDEMDFLLILNKFDQFEQKIDQVPLTVCEWFEDFNPVTSRHRPSNSKNNVTVGQLGAHYIGVKFKRLFASLTDRKLYVSLTNGLDASSVDQALRYAREIIKWEEDRVVASTNDFSVYSTEASSSN